jgi:hypothetical protein
MKGKVLIIEEEGGKNSMATRVKLIKNGLGIKEALDIKFVSFSGLKLDHPESEKFYQFMQLVNEFKPDLIIVDCLQRFVTFECDKENAMISDLMTSIVRPICKKYNLTFYFIHHLRKGSNQNKGAPDDPLDEIRGGSELTNYSRFVLMTQTPRNQTKSDDGGDLFIFKVLKMSNAEMPEPKVLCFKPSDNAITIEYAGTLAETLATEVRVSNAVLDWIFKEQILEEFTTKRIYAAEKEIGFKKSLLSLGLSTLVKQGKLNRIKRGVYQVGNIPDKPKPIPKAQKTLAPTKETAEDMDDLDLSEDEDE